MQIGDKLYRVNRDDRHSSIDTHRFIVIEVCAIFKLRSENIVCFGSLHNLTLTPSSMLDNMIKNGKHVLHIPPSRSADGDTQGLLVVRASSLESAAEEISKDTQNVYVQKEAARDEIKNLMEDELKVMKDRESSLKESIEKLSNTLKEI